VRVLVPPFSILILIVGCAAIAQEPGASDSAAARLGTMRAVADGFSVTTAGKGEHELLQRLEEPVYRFDDPARRFSDGAVWAWGRSGRPAALLTLAKQPAPEGGFRWLLELTSLAPEPISATAPELPKWEPSRAGIAMQTFPATPLPGDDAKKRLRQMRELVRQIKAREFFAPDDQPTRQRYELRVLPQPVHRYADPNSGLIDGGMFIIAYGVNPELVLLVEARHPASSKPEWYYGVARISIAQVHLDFAGKEIWSHPGGLSSGPTDIYWLLTKPVSGES
jgi:hypothetical protein